MQVQRQFKLFVRHPGQLFVSVTGPNGFRPDVGILGKVNDERWMRSSLPDFLDGLIFTLPKQRTSASIERIGKFYHHGEFFIVSQDIKDFILLKCPEGIQVRELNVRDEQNGTIEPAYYALKIRREIDCIDSSKSFYRQGQDTQAFSDGLYSYEVSEPFTRDFANEDGKYVSFPCRNRTEILSVRLKEENIPPDALFFRPRFWPNELIIEQNFSFELSKLCGHMFVALELFQPSAAMHNWHFENR